jgi:hypothetical protein
MHRELIRSSHDHVGIADPKNRTPPLTCALRTSLRGDLGTGGDLVGDGSELAGRGLQGFDQSAGLGVLGVLHVDSSPYTSNDRTMASAC